ncbi:hypothetical protein LV75_002450 [Actinokineospora diospyrosa]|uniref:Uncharacterized protein n=1 Tax=Actinokineospora diospyrosa TaxID=103728 RepID=A0ABT1IBE0_9PSEU|nr:hypothetical protein [Actinokineospora diospyrosa]
MIGACGQQSTLWTTTRQPTQPNAWTLGRSGASSPAVRTAPTHLINPWTLGPSGAIPAPARSAPTHLASPWTLGTAGANPARPRLPCQPSAWTLGPVGANWPAVRSAPAHLLSAWTVGLAGANCSMGWTCFVWGSGSRSVGSGQGHAFRPLLCGPATGVVGAPRKTGPPHRAELEKSRIGPEVAARRRGRPPEPKAEAPKFLPRIPSHGLRQDQPDRKPPNTQPTETHRHNGSINQRPVDSRRRCGQPTPHTCRHNPTTQDQPD